MFICFTTSCLLANSLYFSEMKFISALTQRHSYVCQAHETLSSHIFVRRDVTRVLHVSVADGVSLELGFLTSAEKWAGSGPGPADMQGHGQRASCKVDLSRRG